VMDAGSFKDTYSGADTLETHYPFVATIHLAGGYVLPLLFPVLHPTRR
jgi:hypothetical protein